MATQIRFLPSDGFGIPFAGLMTEANEKNEEHIIPACLGSANFLCDADESSGDGYGHGDIDRRFRRWNEFHSRIEVEDHLLHNQVWSGV